LLIYLAMTGRAHSRDALAELLWADTPATKRDNLKRALANLRKMDDVVLIEEGRQTVALDPNSYQLDVHEFSALAGQDMLAELTQIEKAVASYEADFLAGFNTSLSLEFEEWVLGQQTQLRMQMIDLLNRLADSYLQQQALTKAVDALRRLLALEPWQEAVHRKIIELLACNGDVSGALAHYEICRKNLEAELDVEPSQATVDLMAQIRDGSFQANQSNVSAPSSSIPPTVVQKKERANLSATQTKTTVEYPLVGRAEEWQILSQRWQVHDGCHFIAIGGEAGIGKTCRSRPLSSASGAVGLWTGDRLASDIPTPSSVAPTGSDLAHRDRPPLA